MISDPPSSLTGVFARLVVFPVCRQSGVGLDPEQAPPLPRGVFAEQLVVGVLCASERVSVFTVTGVGALAGDEEGGASP